MKKANPYWNPYVVGVGIGLLIILSFLVTGRGLGAVGAFNGLLASFVHAIAPDYALSNSSFATYVAGVDHPLKDWVVIEIAGVCIGGLLSGLASRRFKFEVIRGPGISSASRLIFAFSGGTKSLLIKGEGEEISTAVEVAEILKNRLYPGVEIANISLGSRPYFERSSRRNYKRENYSNKKKKDL